MTYIDPLCTHGFVIRGHTTKSCHMWSDDIQELLQFAKSIGLKEQWLQKSRLGLLHFDLTPRRREDAINNGAIQLTRRETVDKWKQLLSK